MTFIVVRRMHFGPPDSTVNHPVVFYEIRQERNYFLVAAATREGTTEIKQVFRLQCSQDDRSLEEVDASLPFEAFIEAIDHFRR